MEVTIRKLFLTIFSIIICFALGLAIIVFLLLQNQNDLIHHEAVRYDSYLRADELRQSSDDLTRLARTYVVTGDPLYEKMYWSVLKIRNGEIPRPEKYERIYWDFMSHGTPKPRPDGEKVELQELMKKLKFSKKEFRLLEKAQQNSDALVKMETVAMNAVKGKFADSSGEYSIRKEPDQKLAIGIIHSKPYHTEKAKIMKPIDEFFGMLDDRTKSEVNFYIERGNLYFYILLTLLGCLIIMSGIGYYTIRMRVSVPIQLINNAIRKIADGDFKGTELMLASSSDELGQLGASFKDMQSNMTLLANQAKAIAADKLQDPILSQKVEGDLGHAFLEMTNNLRYLAGQAREIASGKIQSAEQQQSSLQGELGSAFFEMTSIYKLIVKQAEAIAAGDLKADVLEVNLPGVIGDSFGNMVQNLSSTINQIQEAAEQLASASEEFTAMGAQLASSAQDTAMQADNSAAGAEQMIATINEVAKSADMAARTTNDATRIAQQTNETVGALGNSARDIGKIVNVIVDIADKTNLLSLNASIEAAGAGDAGKGFAIVASEVKELAKKTSQATEDIQERIEGIQGSTQKTIIAIDDTTKSINKINDISSSIATSVEEQSATTKSIARSVAQVSSASRATVNNISQMNETAGDLAKMAANLQLLVRNFKV